METHREPEDVSDQLKDEVRAEMRQMRSELVRLRAIDSARSILN
jgi:hypothetical protein